MPPRRLAVTTDFSEESRSAFPRAAALARKFGAELSLVHLLEIPPVMISPWPEVGPYVLGEDAFGGVEAALRELASKEAAFAGLKVEPRVVRGEVIEALADFVAQERVDLIVIASHGRTGMTRFFLGSFAERVLRTVFCPVLIAKTRALPMGPGEDFAPRRILVPHDFSRASRAALEVAREWARAFGAKARLQFVAERTASIYDYASHMEGSFNEYLDKVRAQALERFRRLLREEWKGIDAEAVAVVGDPRVEVLREAKELGADLIVLGTHSRSGLERFFLGSVTQKTVERAECAVLAVRGSET